MKRGVFKPVKNSDSEGLGIYGSRFFDTVKKYGTPSAFEQSRLVVQGFKYNNRLMTHDTTVQRASQRLLLALFLSDPMFHLVTRDFFQSYVQSQTYIERLIFVQPPEIHCYARGTLFVPIVYSTVSPRPFCTGIIHTISTM